MKRRVKRTLLDLKSLAGHLVDSLGDRPAVLRVQVDLGQIQALLSRNASLVLLHKT